MKRNIVLIVVVPLFYIGVVIGFIFSAIKGGMEHGKDNMLKFSNWID